MKYVTFFNGSAFPVVLIFPEWEPHRDIVSRFNKEPRSAGFCSFEGNDVRVFGRSEGLDLEPMEGDADLITLAHVGVM